MTILIVGGNGQVGQELRARAGRDAVAWERAELDISHREDTLAGIADLLPTLVINAAAYTAVDKAETAPADAFAANRDGPANLAEACAQHRIPLLHLSTDYVFDGSKPTPYVDSDTPNPQSVYGRSKWEGEQRVREILPQHIILRVSWVFSQHGSNFVKTILRLARERPELRIVADQRGSPTSATSIAGALISLVQRYQQQGSLPWGTYHFAGSPATTWHGFAVAIIENARAMGLINKMPQIHPIKTSEYPLPAPRPANSLMDCSRTQRELGLMRDDWRDDLRDVIRSLKAAPRTPL